MCETPSSRKTYFLRSRRFFRITPIRNFIVRVLRSRQTIRAVVLRFINNPMITITRPTRNIRLRTKVSMRIIRVSNNLRQRLVTNRLFFIVSRTRIRIFRRRIRNQPRQAWHELLFRRPQRRNLTNRIRQTFVDARFKLTVTRTLNNPTGQPSRLAINMSRLLRQPMR